MKELNAESFVKQLKLEPHPEGGFYKEIYKCSKTIELLEYPDKIRNLSTSIYYLLKSGDVSKFHQLLSDEIWYYHYGVPLNVSMIDKKGILKSVKLGYEIEKGQEPQVIIPAGTIFGAYSDEINSYTLIGCVVTPGFDFKDFKLLSKNDLISQYPQYIEIIEKLT
jgi:hypothetical protein